MPVVGVGLAGPAAGEAEALGALIIIQGSHMFDYLEKFFPELIPSIRRMHPAKRVALVLLLVTIPAIAGYAYNKRAEILALLAQNYIFPGYVVATILVAMPIAAALIALTLQARARRSRLAQFCSQWEKFRQFFLVFFTQIEGWLLHHGGLPRPNSKAWDDAVQMMNEYNEYAEHCANLRRLLFLVGEQNLIVKRVPHWEELKREHEVIREGEYDTPFSFLLDIRNPVGSVNHYGAAIWGALHLSSEFVEYLAYKHAHLQKIIGARQEERVHAKRA